MERKKGSFILNDGVTTWTGVAQAIHVVTDCRFQTIKDSKNQDKNYYIQASALTIPAGTYIAARDGAKFNNILLSLGAVEIIF
jgi:hypothetical protein